MGDLCMCTHEPNEHVTKLAGLMAPPCSLCPCTGLQVESQAGGMLRASYWEGRAREHQERLRYINEQHVQHFDSAGGTSGDCVECALTWPCPTAIWSADDCTRSPLTDPWDPHDDELTADLKGGA